MVGEMCLLLQCFYLAVLVDVEQILDRDVVLCDDNFFRETVRHNDNATNVMFDVAVVQPGR